MSKLEAAKQYFREVRTETRKVTYPSRQDTVATTWVVIGVVLVIGFYLGLVDLGLSQLMGLVM